MEIFSKIAIGACIVLPVSMVYITYIAKDDFRLDTFIALALFFLSLGIIILSIPVSIVAIIALNDIHWSAEAWIGFFVIVGVFVASRCK